MEVRYTPITDRPDLGPVFGPMTSETAAAVLARLRDADEGSLRLGRALDAAAQPDGERSRIDRLGLYLHPTVSPDLDGYVTSAITIDNADGTISHGAVDVCFGIDTFPSTGDRPLRWHVGASVSVNCDRRRCVDDPHELRYLSGEAASPLEAADLLVSQIDELCDWVASQPDVEWKIFRHSDS